MAPLRFRVRYVFNVLIYYLGVPDSSENLQSRCGLKWKEMQREND